VLPQSIKKGRYEKVFFSPTSQVIVNMTKFCSKEKEAKRWEIVDAKNTLMELKEGLPN
jgi:hypothetical protein